MEGINDELVTRLYQDFCEAEGGVDHPVLEAWEKCQETYGDITTGNPIDRLFMETIRYVIDTIGIDKEAADKLIY
jgi:hypothetical protein